MTVMNMGYLLIISYPTLLQIYAKHYSKSILMIGSSSSSSHSRSDQLVAINGESILDNTLEETETCLMQFPAGPVMIDVVRPDSVEPLNKLLMCIKKDKGTTYKFE